MKKLPKLYKNESSNMKDNNRKSFSIKEDTIVDNYSSMDVLNSIFNGLGHPYNQKVFLKTKNKTYETYLVSKTKQNVLTLENEQIPIQDILFLKKID